MAVDAREWSTQPERERRLQNVERDVDRLLDPETGIYAKLAAMESRLKSVAISVLVAVLLNIAIVISGAHFR